MNSVALTRTDIESAKLPINYVQARISIQKCESVDECKLWGDKAAALASYAKQSRDHSLYNAATRIRARAVRRCGQLLRGIEIEHKTKHGDSSRGRHKTSTQIRSAAATKAGLTGNQVYCALTLASIEESKFENAIEADSPLSVSKLVEENTHHRTKPIGISVLEYNAAVGIVEHIKQLIACCESISPKAFCELMQQCGGDTPRVLSDENFSMIPFLRWVDEYRSEQSKEEWLSEQAT